MSDEDKDKVQNPAPSELEDTPAKPVARMVTPTNRLKNKVGGNMSNSMPGQFDERLIAQAQAAVGQLRPPYKDQSVEDLLQLQRLVREAEQREPQDRAAQMQKIARVALNVQGLGDSFGYQLMTRFGRSLRRFTEQLETATNEQLLIVRAHIDAMRVVMTQDIRGDGGPIGQELTAMLEKAIKQYGGS
jgi:hypothetical protein